MQTLSKYTSTGQCESSQLTWYLLVFALGSTVCDGSMPSTNPQPCASLDRILDSGKCCARGLHRKILCLLPDRPRICQRMHVTLHQRKGDRRFHPLPAQRYDRELPDIDQAIQDQPNSKLSPECQCEWLSREVVLSQTPCVYLEQLPWYMHSQHSWGAILEYTAPRDVS